MATTQCNWNGHQFDVHVPNVSWNDIGGIYIFAKQQSPQSWGALYIGQASSLKSRLLSHERWSEAVQCGATHIHAMVVTTQFERDKLERELIQWAQPMMNELFKNPASPANLASLLGVGRRAYR